MPCGFCNKSEPPEMALDFTVTSMPTRDRGTTEAILNGERSRWHRLDDMNYAKSTFVQAAAADLPAATRLCPRS
jgi:hypothetical protein